MNITTYSKDIEPEVLAFWEKNDIFGKAQKKNKGKKKFYFLQGPPYTSGRIHIGQAWNNSAKDIIMRYKRMQGFDVWDRAGYDMHGLPTANAVMKKLELKNKDEIVEYGIGKFIKECIKFSSDKALLMDKDLWRMGVWMDYDNAYWPIKNYFIEGEWWLIKRAQEENRLYKGKKVMTWCASCETGLAKHELEYETDKDTSIFVKFQSEKDPNEHLIIWTTTPWTIPFNLAVMVNPDLEYVKAKVDNEVWIISKALVNALCGSWDKKYKILETFKGSNLEGYKYKHPMIDNIPSLQEVKNKHKNTHSIIMSKEFVDVTAGSGLVHCAPGCGPEDQVVGKQFGLPAYNNLDEEGIFQNMGEKYNGKIAKVNDKFFIEELQNLGVLIETAQVEHEYAHCWRCHKPVIFRATKQWFMKVEDLRDKMIKANKETTWIPKDFTKRYDAWISNLRDNSIARQRFWGCPVPIWECKKCKHVIVIGSVDELKKHAVEPNKIPKDLHRPWIDEVKLKCKCGAEIERVPDVLDVWIDSGTASWNCLEYPNKEDFFKEWWPADFILEASEQVRLWYSMLNICSMIAFGKNSYKAVYSHGMLLDYQGTKMSKSIGNIISPYEIIDKNGADVLRYYMNQTTAGENINFNWDAIKIKQRNIMVLWNVHKFMIGLAKELDLNPFKLDEDLITNLLDIEERYIISKLNSTIKEVTELFDQYRLDETIGKIEELFLSLSRNYIQMIRDKASIGKKSEKEVVLYTINKVLFESIKMFNVITPFICEKIFLNLKEEFKLKSESINLLDWPKANENLINTELEKNIDVANVIIQSTLYAREKAGLGVRWPVKLIEVISKEDFVIKAVEETEDIIKQQTNVKTIHSHKNHPSIKQMLQLNFKKVRPDFGEKSAQIIASFAAQNQDKIFADIAKNGKFVLKLENESVDLKKEHFIINRDVPEHLIEVPFRHGFIYLDKTRTDELEAEGFARETMRRVQAARKNAGLEKQDTIALLIQVDEEVKEMILPWSDKIQEKCGAPKIKIDTTEPAKKHEFSSEDKIKKKIIKIHLDKI